MALRIARDDPTKIDPVWDLMHTISQELDAGEFESLKTLLTDKLSKKILDNIQPEKSYHEEKTGDREMKNNIFLRALHSQYGTEGMLKLLKNATKKLQIHVDGELLSDIIETCEQEWRQNIQDLEEQGNFTANFVGRHDYIEEIMKDFKVGRRGTISGVLVCGMYGIGKTSLASVICNRLTTFRICYIDLKEKMTIEELFSSMMHSVGLSVIEDKNVLFKWLKEQNEETILLLDNADDLMDSCNKMGFRDFQETLLEVTKIHNPKVKLFITSRFKITGQDGISTENIRQGIGRMDGAIREYELKELKLEECIELFDNEAGILKDQLKEEDKEKLAELCGFSPMAVKLAAKQLKMTGMPADNLFKDEKGSMPSKMLHDSTKDFVSSILARVMKSLDPSWQKKLGSLVVFDTAFDSKAAGALMESGTSLDAALDLQYLICRHLVEVNDLNCWSGKKQDINVYDEENVRYSLHTLTSRYLKIEFENKSPKSKSELKEAEVRFTKHFLKQMQELGKQANKEPYKAFSALFENSMHIKKVMKLQKKFDLVIKIEKEKHFQDRGNVTLLLERFLSPEERILYFGSLKEICLKKGLKMTGCFNHLWEVEQHIQRESVSKSMVMLEGINKEMEALRQNRDYDGQLRMVEAFSNYVNARYLLMTGQREEAMRLLQSAQKIYKENLQDSTFLARTLNLLGSLYFQKEDFEKARKYHTDAYQLLRKNISDGVHFDFPTYLMNIGTVYHRMANRSGKDEDSRKAIEYYNQSLDLHKKLGTYGYEASAMVIRNKALLLSRLAEFEDAIKMADEANDINIFQHGRKAARTGASYHFLGTMYQKKAQKCKKGERVKQLERAEKCFDESLTVFEACCDFPLDMKEYLSLKNDMEDILLELGKKPKLLSVNKRISDIETKMLSGRPVDMNSESSSSDEDNLVSSKPSFQESRDRKRHSSTSQSSGSEGTDEENDQIQIERRPLKARRVSEAAITIPEETEDAIAKWDLCQLM